MTGENYSIEHVTNIWDDETGERYVIREDSDGLGLPEIQYVDPDNKVQARITMTIQLAERFLKEFSKWIEGYKTKV